MFLILKDYQVKKFLVTNMNDLVNVLKPNDKSLEGFELFDIEIERDENNPEFITNIFVTLKKESK